MEPLTGQCRVSGPVVYGFLRLLGPSAARQRALTTAIDEYCKSHEFTLGGMFTERFTSTAAAFTGLLQVLKVPGSYGRLSQRPPTWGRKRWRWTASGGSMPPVCICCLYAVLTGSSRPAAGRNVLLP